MSTMRALLKKSEGIAILTIDDVVKITVRYTDDYVTGELGHLCQIIHAIYRDDQYYRRHQRKKHSS